MRLLSALLSALLFVPLVVAAAALSARPDKIPGASGTLFVTERTAGTSSVTAYDAGTGDSLWTTAVGSRPIGVVHPHGTDKVYSSDEVANSMSVLDRETGERIKVIGMGPLPHHLMASTDGRYVYVAEFGRNQVGVVETDGDTRQRGLLANVGPEAADVRTHAVWVPSHDRFIYATNSRSDRNLPGDIAKIDVASGLPVWNLTVGRDPSEVLVTANEKIAYVSVRGDDAIVVIDVSGDTPAVLASVPIGDQPDTLSLTNDGKWLIVGLRDTTGAKMALMNTDTLAVRTVPLTGRTTGHQWLSANGKYTFIAVEGPGTPVGAGGGVAVVDNDAGQIDFYPYPTGKPLPHGVFYEPKMLR